MHRIFEIPVSEAGTSAGGRQLATRRRCSFGQSPAKVPLPRPAPRLSCSGPPADRVSRHGPGSGLRSLDCALGEPQQTNAPTIHRASRYPADKQRRRLIAIKTRRSGNDIRAPARSAAVAICVSMSLSRHTRSVGGYAKPFLD